MVKYFHPLYRVSNELKHYILFIAKNISFIQFSSCHTSDENVLASKFSQTTVSIFIGVDILLISEFVVVVIL